MKKLFALSVVLFSLVGGSVAAFADSQDGFGVPTVSTEIETQNTESRFGHEYGA